VKSAKSVVKFPWLRLAALSSFVANSNCWIQAHLPPNRRPPFLRAALASPDSRLQTFKEQARQRRTPGTLPRFG